MNLKRLQAFRAVFEAASVTQAAERLHTTQPAVSRLIGDLVPRHSDYDWLTLSQSRMGRSSGATRIWMLLATPG